MTKTLLRVTIRFVTSESIASVSEESRSSGGTGAKVLVGVLIGAAVVGGAAAIVIAAGAAAVPAIVVGLEAAGDVVVGTELVDVALGGAP